MVHGTRLFKHLLGTEDAPHGATATLIKETLRHPTRLIGVEQPPSSTKSGIAANLVRASLAQPILPAAPPPIYSEIPIRENLPGQVVVSNIPTASNPNPKEGEGNLTCTDNPPPPYSPHDSSIWARAFERFCEHNPELATDYAKHISGDAANPDPKKPPSLRSIRFIMDQVQRHRAGKQWTIPLAGKDINVREHAESFCKFLLWSDKIVKEALSAQPYAALAWTGVSILLPLLTTGADQNSAMLHGFSLVDNTLVFWRNCEEAYLNGTGTPSPDKHGDLVAAVTMLYSLMIEYQARTICHLSKAQLSRAWEKVAGWNDWAGWTHKIQAADKRCRELIDPVQEQQLQQKMDDQLRAMQESRAILGEIRQVLDETRAQNNFHHQDNLERRLLHDLASDYEGYKNENPQRVGGTCEWFFDDPRFRVWRDGSSGYDSRYSANVLWVSASPDCGKSVLCRALIDENRLSTRISTSTVCHFFFESNDHRRSSAAAALSAILHQLLTRRDFDPTLLNEALRRHRSYGPKLAQSTSQLWQILSHYALSPSAGEIICVLDALDECDATSRDALLGHLRDWCSPLPDNTKHEKNKNKLKFFITTRSQPYFEPHLRRLASCAHPSINDKLQHIDMDATPENLEHDLSLYIDSRVPEVTSGLTQEEVNEISSDLKSRKHRSYCWLRRTFEMMEKRPGGVTRGVLFPDAGRRGGKEKNRNERVGLEGVPYPERFQVPWGHGDRDEEEEERWPNSAGAGMPMPKPWMDAEEKEEEVEFSMRRPNTWVVAPREGKTFEVERVCLDGDEGAKKGRVGACFGLRI